VQHTLPQPLDGAFVAKKFPETHEFEATVFSRPLLAATAQQQCRHDSIEKKTGAEIADNLRPAAYTGRETIFVPWPASNQPATQVQSDRMQSAFKLRSNRLQTAVKPHSNCMQGACKTPAKNIRIGSSQTGYGIFTFGV
jgi:hypothetical protein